jgi:hypothetical protein
MNIPGIKLALVSSKDWKMNPPVFPDIGKAHGIFPKPWKIGCAFSQTLENRKHQLL